LVLQLLIFQQEGQERLIRQANQLNTEQRMGEVTTEQNQQVITITKIPIQNAEKLVKRYGKMGKL